eukprot:CAMPEP_0185833326 /NCGR_PEP_ID=MMETSP1353-20130828/2609_1 /TAXON_ID=1077150 /ORGANISM="Erythrolobus australicus, Strain CCMP3124" /LENGTH=614 /DNA_ID=CAMNT_0028531595 /DNA_START=351 /DNA_END=2195 /DNA_ORIENTATION=-
MANVASAFHAGELAVQARAGTLGVASELSSALSSALSPAAGVLISSLPYAFITSVEPGTRRVWTSPAFATGENPLRAISSTQIELNRPAIPADDPFHANTSSTPHAPVSLLAIDLLRRQRYRTNGTLHGSHIAVTEAFPNCPKYIQRRELQPHSAFSPPVSSAEQSKAAESDRLDDEAALKLVANSDTFFIGSFLEGVGADTNHRGGARGFVRVLSDGRALRWGEYRGNGMFQTSGNLALSPRAALLFLDFERGDVLQISGSASVEWTAELDPLERAAMLDDADHSILFRIERVRFTRGATQFRWHLLDASPYNPALRPFASHDANVQQQQQQQQHCQQRGVLLRLVKIVQESDTVRTFRFVAPTRQRFLPGQYATLLFEGAAVSSRGENGGVVRTWTISETAQSPVLGDDTLEVSIKRKDGGKMSTLLHSLTVASAQALQASGELRIALLGIDGELTPVVDDSNIGGGIRVKADKLLLLSGGIGITPFVAMIRGLRAFGFHGVDVVALHSEQRANDLPFRAELERRARDDSRLHFWQFVTRECIAPLEADANKSAIGVREGRIDVSAIQTLAPDVREREVFLCGPDGFLVSITHALESLGLDAQKIHTERFDF